MRKNLIITLVLLMGCAQKGVGPMLNSGGDTRTKAVEMLDNNTYLLTESTTDNTYAFKQINPVKVGGIKESAGPVNERRYLNALLGPNGEQVRYFRAGSCCPFKTPNGMIENSGLLDRYRVYWEGGKDTLDVFINMYDLGDLKIPVGLRAKSK